MVRNQFRHIVQIVDYQLQLILQGNVIAVLVVFVGVAFIFGYFSNAVDKKKLLVMIMNILVQDVDL